MKLSSLSIFLLLIFSFNHIYTQDKTNATKPEAKLENQIRQYWFVMLTTGTNRTHDSATAVKIQEGHMANITRLYKDGKIKVAGPFGDNGNWRGIFIFDCATKEEVEKLLNTDPAVSSGRLAYEVHSWYTAPIGSFQTGQTGMIAWKSLRFFAKALRILCGKK